MTASLITSERIQFLIENTTPVFSDQTIGRGSDDIILADMPEIERYLRAKCKLQLLSEKYSQLLYFASKVSPTLSNEQEKHLFRKYHYLKGQVVIFIGRKCYIEADRIFTGPLSSVKNEIISANLRLVVRLIQKNKIQYRENLLDGAYDALNRCVEIFNWTSGNKFSTYATTAVKNSIKRTLAKIKTRPKFLQFQEELVVARESNADYYGKIRGQIERLLSELDERKRYILSRRYGIIAPQLTQKEIGVELGISHKAISLIERQAIDFLRRSSRRKQVA